MNLNRIAITGPESTGKSLLARQLAFHYNTLFVPELARDYLNNLGRNYEFEDIAIIAKEQLSLENRLARKSDKLMFCDTDILVTKIWSQYKYGKCDPWIEEHVKAHRYNLYLLCDIDLPWEDDPLREHPDERMELFKIYKAELVELRANFKIISGMGAERLGKAILAVDEAFG